jgi:hypothetical protein
VASAWQSATQLLTNDVSHKTGSPIVSEKWVDACARSDMFVDAKEFLLKDPAAEKKFGFSLAAAWETAQQSLLLHGVHVFLTPGQLFLSTSDTSHNLAKTGHIFVNLGLVYSSDDA